MMERFTCIAVLAIVSLVTLAAPRTLRAQAPRCPTEEEENTAAINQREAKVVREFSTNSSQRSLDQKLQRYIQKNIQDAGIIFTTCIHKQHKL